MSAYGLTLLGFLLASPQSGFQMYGLHVPLTTRVVNVKVAQFPWWSLKKAKNKEALDKLLKKGSKPAIVFLSKHSRGQGKQTLANEDYFYFQQAAVKKRLDDFRWYWASHQSPEWRLVAKKYAIHGDSALLIFDRDGSLTLREQRISAGTVAQAMHRLEHMGKMHEVVLKDLPNLKKRLSKDDVRPVIKYLQYSEKYKDFVSLKTDQLLKEFSESVTKRGDELIDKALELDAEGQRSEAMKILNRVTHEFKPLKPSVRAKKTAKKLREKKAS